MISEQRITMIGGGNMGRAIISGLIDKGYEKSKLEIIEPDHDRAATLARECGVKCVAAFSQLAQEPTVIVLAVKPQIMRTVAEELAPQIKGLRQPPLVISIAAGITTTQLNRWLGGGLKIIRVMPNTPAMVGAGASALFADAQLSSDDRTVATEILGAVGITVWVDQETDIDAVTALSGSGPAYFFLIQEALEAEAVALGLEAKTARQLAVQTALGSALLARQSTLNPSELRQQVTSPGGTTERAIEVLLSEGLPKTFSLALKAAYERAKELGAETKK
ncbi:MAG: pyrroline-5-carboxylate reductase [Gammaproteobacteria bacterium]